MRGAALIGEPQMANAWQLTATHMIDLGYEQLMMLKGQSGSEVRVLFRGVSLGRTDDPTDATDRDVARTYGAKPCRK